MAFLLTANPAHVTSCKIEIGSGFVVMSSFLKALRRLASHTGRFRIRPERTGQLPIRPMTMIHHLTVIRFET